MTPSARKTFWWYALAASMGGTAFFVFICIIETPPPAAMLGVYVWPLSCIATTVAAIWRLRRCYRDEPDAFRGFFQLSIIDLYAVVLFAALWMGGWRTLSMPNFVPTGVVISLLMTMSYALCLLVAARYGFTSSTSKIPYALGLQFKTVGWLSLGAMMVTILFLILYRGDFQQAWEVLRYCIVGTMGRYMTDSLLLPLRVGLPFLPVGTLICWIVDRRKDANSFSDDTSQVTHQP